MSLPPNGDAEMEAECEEMENNWAGEEEQAAVVHNIKVMVVIRACCREVKIPNQFSGVILWCLFMYRIDS